ncbi:alpha/beta hydrolase [Streptomyces sp. NPDC026673]|uniref:alpha/beta hydrolase n=1 Tax=Streptomyces sp. NPDC026673 TaxID=3155724 RepID=UPI0033D499E0
MTTTRTTAGSGGTGLRRTVALWGACGLLLTACATGGRNDPAAGDVPAELLPYYRQTLHWETCPDRPAFQCATLKAPLDYARPEAGDIRLGAIRERATGDGAERIGSLLFNPGGPGGSAIDDLVSYTGLFSPAMRAAYDLVAVDPRGVGRSTPVICPEDTAATLPESEEREFEDFDAESARTAAACGKHAGRLLPHVGTLDTARDLDVVRALLGDERLHFLGYSYGTYLGATYAELFPARVGRLVLDGALDPTLDGYHFYLGQIHGYQVAWEAFAAHCATLPDCPVGRSVTETNRTLDTMADILDRAPLRQGKDITITGGDLLAAVMNTLNPAAWDVLRQLLGDVRAGDGALLQRFLDEDTTVPGDQSYAAISCLSSPLGPRLTAAQAKASLPEFLRASPQFGALYAVQLPRCAHWPAMPNQPSHPIAAHGSAPILVVGTTRDPATPYVWARALAGQLDSGRLLTLDGDGHGAYLLAADTCVDGAVDRYFLLGLLPPAGEVCRSAPGGRTSG